MLGTTLATQIGSAMATVADSMKEMTAAFEKQHRRPQLYSSDDDTCVVDALASRSCSQDGVEGKSSFSLAKFRERGASRSVSADGADCDFTPHGCQPTHPADPVSSPPNRCASSRFISSPPHWGPNEYVLQ